MAGISRRRLILAAALALAAVVSAAFAPLVRAQLDFDNLKKIAKAGRSLEPRVQVQAQFTVAKNDRPAQLFLTATIEPEWHIYSTTQQPPGPNGGPIKAKIKVDASDQFKLLGDFAPTIEPKRYVDPGFKIEVETFEGTVIWSAPIELAAGVNPQDLTIGGSLKYQACNKSGCEPPETAKFAAKLGNGPNLAAATPNAPAGDTGLNVSALRVHKTGGQNSLLLTLAAALLGGLILNCMPCVLPVIGLKILGFVEQSADSRQRVLLLNVWFSLGLMSVFLGLATLAAFLNLGWGEQFTSIGFTIVMAAVVFAMALSFLGVWEIPIPGFIGGGKAGNLAAKEGVAGAFTKGIVTTILATPCSGPFLGPVFGFTLGQPPWVIYAIFACVGLGMASPYLLIGAFPRLIRFLPKPGAWMDTLKQIMGFVLLGTVVYLFSTLKAEYVIPALAMIVGLWAGCWWIGRTPVYAELKEKSLAWLGGAAITAAVALFAFTWLVPGGQTLPWQPFSRQALVALTKEQKTVLVDFTADWCPTCKYNEATALNTRDVGDLVEQYGIVPLRADWTDHGDEIKDMLALLGYRSIPVYAIFPADRPNEPILLSDLISKKQILEKLREAGPSKKTDEKGAVAAMD
jgi:suppressor for copper-sensitivity B